jgi:hypothetical protein
VDEIDESNEEESGRGEPLRKGKAEVDFGFGADAGPWVDASPLDGLMPATDFGGVDDDDDGKGSSNDNNNDGDRDRNNDRISRRSPPRVREPIPCYRVTPSFTAAATSAS